MSKVKRNYGFTLAEILVTLVVIGIVAALTVPALLANVQKSQYVSALYKVVSDISQASTYIKIDNGGSYIGVFTDDNNMRNLFCSKLNCIKTCSSGDAPGTCWVDGNSWTSLSGDPAPFGYSASSSAVLSNGAMLYFAFYSTGCTDNRYKLKAIPLNCGEIYIDVNGFNPPNILGRDIFSLLVTQNGIIPNGVLGTSLADYCYPSAHTSWQGCGCAGKIFKENGMNY